MSAPRVAPTRSRRGDRSMFPLPQARPPAQSRLGRRSALRAGMAGCLAALLSACSGAGVSNSDLFTSNSPPPPSEQTARNAIGTGQVRVGLVLPLSASGNAGLAGQSMRNAAELALAEFNNPNIQLLVKDDAGTAQGAQQAAQQALDEGAEIIIGPLFAHSVSQVGKVADAAKLIAQAATRADVIFIPDAGEGVAAAAQALAANGLNLKRLQVVGTGLWDDPRIFADPALEGGWFAAPDSGGFRSFAGRYRARYGQDPVRTATLAYDAVALVAALVKTQGPQRFTPELLTNASGFAGIDGVFRFRADGTNQRGLAVLRATPSGGQVIAPAPRTFGASGT